jgi:hypothetical protein
MKKNLLLLLLILTSINFHSQNKNLIGRTYVFTSTVPLTMALDKNYADMNVANDEFITVVEDDCDLVQFKIKGDVNVYTIEKAKFLYNTEVRIRRYKGVEVGVYTIPFRLRGDDDNFDFESALSLQTNIAFGFGTKESEESWFDASVGIGLSSINLDNNNSKVIESRTASALTLSTGFVFKPAKNANIGIFFGGDFLGQSDKEIDWKYDKNLWIGIGINISFNKIETTIAAASK